MKKKLIAVESRYELIHKFLEITKWMNKLRPLEMDVLAKLINLYLEFKEKGYSEEIILVLLGDYKYKMQIKTELDNMEDSIFQNLLSSLRRKGMISGFNINKDWIPDIKDGTFVLAYGFKIDGKDNA